MKTRTSRPPGDISQSTSSYPIGGSVLSSNSPSFTAPPKTPVPKKNGLSSPFLLLIGGILAEKGGDLKGLPRERTFAGQPESKLTGVPLSTEQSPHEPRRSLR